MASYFEWSLNPEIVHIAGPFGLRWYSLCFLSGILMGYHFFGKMLLKAGKPLELRDNLLYYIVIGTVVGARLGHVLFYDPQYYFSNPIRILKVWEGGLASHGGFTGVMVALLLFSRKFKELSFFWLTDRIAIVAILAGACIRIGNFLNSEIIGRVTDVPWAVIFLNVDNQPRHPTQLYEFFGYLSISAFLYLVYRMSQYKPLEGRIFGLAMIVAFSFRFFIEFLKENQVTYEKDMLWNMGQLLSLPFIGLGIFLALGIQHKVRGFNWAFSEDIKSHDPDAAKTAHSRSKRSRRKAKSTS